MSIKSIKVKNLLSFDELIIDNFEDINCIVGKNNAGKSNLLKLLRFFYNKLEEKRELPPKLYSNYSAFGTITIIYSISQRTKQHLKDKHRKYFNNKIELTLKIYSNDSIEWSIKNKDILKTINYLYPFFDIEARHIDLYNWDRLWSIISSLKSFNLKKLEQNLFNKEKENNKEFNHFIKLINKNIDTKKYTYGSQLLAFIKARIKGDRFTIGEDDLTTQSDGTNAHKFIESSLKLLLVLTKREYITPIIYIDEPEIGLHPKKNEELIESVYNTYKTEKRITEAYPTIIFATHSPNIVKQVIKLFDENQQILHFSKEGKQPTVVQKMNSQYTDKRFLNVFSDNEARLFFSNFILFVEGATEVEIFRNQKLNKNFKKLNKIDVYEAKESMLKYINPAYSNTSIPYLVLYDADKFIDINIEKKKISFKRDVINLVTYCKKYQKAYLYSKQKNIYFIIKILLDEEKSTKLNFKKNLYITTFNYSELIKYINVHFLNKENYFLNKTTIEESLINQNSFFLFKRWIFSEFRITIKQSYNSKTPSHIIEKTIKEKVIEIKNFKKCIDTSFNTKEEKITAMILIFGGKTETSITTSTDNYNKLSQNFRDNIKILKKDYIQNKKSLNLGYLIGKTSGWATSFLNFSIDKIEKNRGENEFKYEFKKYFGELYDIISIIEKKL